MTSIAKLFLPATAIVFAGCATTAPRATLPAVQTQLRERADVQATWPLTEDERTQAVTATRELLARDLTVESAVQIALLNNRALRVTFEEIGLSQADVAAASRLPNPTLGASVRWPQDRPRGPNVEFGLTAPLLDSLLLPLRTRIAQDQLAQVQRRVVHEVLSLVAEVKRAAYEVLARQDIRARLAVIAEINDAAADLSRRQYDAGNIPNLELAQTNVSAQQTQLDLLRADADLRAAREHLNRLLGLMSGQTEWRLSGSLPVLPPTDPTLDNLEALALDQRLDLAAARSQVGIAEKALNLKRRTRLLPGTVDFGVDTEREAGGGRVTGPRLDLQLPVFDQGQPEVARLAAAVRQAQDRADALAADIGSDVRTARDALRAAREAAEFFQKNLLPQRRLILRETLLHYNAMQKSPYELLLAKEQQQTAERMSIEVLRDYWLARTELERAIGGRLPGAADAPPVEPPAKPEDAPSVEHHHHSNP